MPAENATPRVSVIVPSLCADTTRLERLIRQQKGLRLELVVVRGVRPNGRARNVGVERATGNILLFFDDDACPPDETMFQRMLRPLLRDDFPGIVGCSKLIPRSSPAFQKQVAREIPRIEHAVAARDAETNPSLNSYGFSEITTTCCAMRRSDFERVGGFSEELIRGVDTEFFYRVHKAGLRFLLVANTWVYHPAPGDLRSLLRKYFQMGIGHFQEAHQAPDRGIGIRFRGLGHVIAYLLFRTAYLLPNIFVPYSFAYRRWELACKPLKALASYVNGLGYCYGWWLSRRGRGPGTASGPEGRRP